MIKKHQKKKRLMTSIAVLAVIFSTAVYSSAEPASPVSVLEKTGAAFSAIAELATPAVVFINAEKSTVVDMPTQPFGYILTNHHVIGDADKITVKLHNGREFEAERIEADAKSEVAVIKIDSDDLPFLELGDSAAIRVGEGAA